MKSDLKAMNRRTQKRKERARGENEPRRPSFSLRPLTAGTESTDSLSKATCRTEGMNS